jgi:hypothetical protein
MKFVLKYVAPVLAILWLAQVSPLGAVVAILLCVIRCAFKSHVLSTMFAHFVYDVLKSITMGVARLIFRRRRG